MNSETIADISNVIRIRAANISDGGAMADGAELRDIADRIEAAVQRFVADECAKCAHYNAATISLKDALDLANTIANHGIDSNDLGDKASATIYALCHEVRTVRGEDANIKQEVQKLRRELRDLRRAPGNAAAMREALSDACYAMFNFLKTQPGGYEEMAIALDKAKAALAAPARNCDKYGIDDIKEMDADFGAFCRQYGAKDGEHCVGCPIKPMDNLCCHSAWMLLAAEGGAE